MTPSGIAIQSDQQAESESQLPEWRFQRCTAETERFPAILLEVIASIENIICTILTNASPEQTNTFRQPLTALQTTTFYRYHSSCSTLQTRDCLVVREAKNAIRLISSKYRQLIVQSSSTTTMSSSNYDDEMDNSI